MVDEQTQEQPELQRERITVSQEWLDRLTAALREMETRRNRLRAEAAELDRLIQQQVGAVGLMQELVGGNGEK
jgi:hypothetical protein